MFFVHLSTPSKYPLCLSVSLSLSLRPPPPPPLYPMLDTQQLILQKKPHISLENWVCTNTFPIKVKYTPKIICFKKMQRNRAKQV